MRLKLSKLSRLLLIPMLLLALTASISAEENPWDGEEDPECYAESGMNCEELSEQWDEENPQEEEE